MPYPNDDSCEASAVVRISPLPIALADFDGSVWAMDPRAFAKMTAGVPGAIVPETRQPRLPKVQGKIAVLPLTDVLSQRGEFWGSSTDSVGLLIDTLIDQPGIGAVVLDIDSPGGIVYGTPELATKILSARDKKPILAVANSLAASAAYWIGSAATRFYATPSAKVGSIGVFVAHVDLSQALEAAGVRVTMIQAGRYKTEGSPFAPLTEEATAKIQGDVDRYYDMFIDAVAAGRKVPPRKVRTQWGEGRTFLSPEAKELGLVDDIATLDEVLAGLLAQQAKREASQRASEIRRAEIELWGLDIR